MTTKKGKADESGHGLQEVGAYTGDPLGRVWPLLWDSGGRENPDLCAVILARD